MILRVTLKNEVHKTWFLRFMALIITTLCAITLHDVGEPRPLHIAILRGVVDSLILNGTLWLSSFKWIRVKLKYIVALFIFISGLGVFIVSPYGWTLAFLLLIFHIWFTYDLVVGKEKL